MYCTRWNKVSHGKPGSKWNPDTQVQPGKRALFKIPRPLLPALLLGAQTASQCREKEDAHPAVASFWMVVAAVTSSLGAGDVVSISSRFPPISEPGDSEFLPFPSPRTYLCSTHSPCQLWKLQKSRQPGMGIESSHCSAIERNHDHHTDRLTTHISQKPAVQILTSLVHSTGWLYFGVGFSFILLWGKYNQPPV